MTDRRLREDDEEREFFAVRIDETAYLGKEYWEKEYGVVPSKLYSVYATDLGKTYIASMTPSVFMVHAYTYPVFSDAAGRKWWEEEEAALEMEADLNEGNEDTYFDWGDINRKRGTKDMVSIGEFDSDDDAREFLAGNHIL